MTSSSGPSVVRRKAWVPLEEPLTRKKVRSAAHAAAARSSAAGDSWFGKGLPSPNASRQGDTGRELRRCGRLHGCRLGRVWDRAELPQQSQIVVAPPMLDDLTVGDAQDVHAGHLDGLAGR